MASRFEEFQRNHWKADLPQDAHRISGSGGTLDRTPNLRRTSRFRLHGVREVGESQTDRSFDLVESEDRGTKGKSKGKTSTSTPTRRAAAGYGSTAMSSQEVTTSSPLRTGPLTTEEIALIQKRRAKQEENAKSRAKTAACDRTTSRST